MGEFIVIDQSTYVQLRVVNVNGEYKVYSMNGSESKVNYAVIESGLQNGKYKKMVAN